MKRLLSVLLSLALVITSVFAVDLYANAQAGIMGIDISEHDGNFDLANARNDGNDFVMIRLGYYNHIDKQFFENVKKAVDNEMNFGLYLYSYAYSLDEAQIEADFVIDTISQLGDMQKYLTLPIAYDLEDSSLLNHCSKEQITNQMVLFCDQIKSAGYTPMVYANKNWFNNYIDFNTVISKEYKIWYAFWPNTPDLETPITINDIVPDIWQYSTTNETLDKNIMYSPSELINPLSCYHSYTTSDPVASTCKNNGYVLHTCSACGNEFKVTLPKTSHSYVTTKATLTKNGVIKCKDCNNIKSTVYYPKTISLSATSYTYDGKAKKPTVTVKDSKGNKIASSNYTVAYSNNKNVGKASVKITFKGNYSGTKTVYFTIKPKGTSVSKVTAASKGFTVKWKKQATQTTGYQIQYATDSAFKKNCKTVTVSKNSTTSKKIAKLKGKKKYYVRVRTYKTVNGTKYYSSWSKAKTVTTKK